MLHHTHTHNHNHNHNRHLSRFAIAGQNQHNSAIIHGQHRLPHHITLPGTSIGPTNGLITHQHQQLQLQQGNNRPPTTVGSKFHVVRRSQNGLPLNMTNPIYLGNLHRFSNANTTNASQLLNSLTTSNSNNNSNEKQNTVNQNTTAAARLQMANMLKKLHQKSRFQANNIHNIHNVNNNVIGQKNRIGSSLMSLNTTNNTNSTTNSTNNITGLQQSDNKTVNVNNTNDKTQMTNNMIDINMNAPTMSQQASVQRERILRSGLKHHILQMTNSSKLQVCTKCEINVTFEYMRSKYSLLCVLFCLFVFFVFLVFVKKIGNEARSTTQSETVLGTRSITAIMATDEPSTSSSKNETNTNGPPTKRRRKTRWRN